MSHIVDILSKNDHKMADNIKRIYIINGKKELIFSYNNPEYETIVDESLFSRFILAMNSFAREFGEEQISNIDLGNEKIFYLKDKCKRNLFIVVFNKNVQINRKSIKLDEIKKLIIEKYIKKVYDLDKKKFELSLLELLDNSLPNCTGVEQFLNSL